MNNNEKRTKKKFFIINPSHEVIEAEGLSTSQAFWYFPSEGISIPEDQCFPARRAAINAAIEKLNKIMNSCKESIENLTKELI